ncbi:4'-phosphopantetheinyl transferase superfamily protein [Mucilaginibacter sp. AW1-3]
MKSTGNDIVALGSVNKLRTNRFNFYSKILSVSEQQLYQSSRLTSLSFEYYVWLLWSVKESAYKYLKRLEPQLIFSPVNIIVQTTAPAEGHLEKDHTLFECESKTFSREFYTGKVTYAAHTLYFRSIITTDWITTVVNDTESFENVYWGVKTINDVDNESRSTEVRDFLLNKLSKFFGTLRIEKSPVGYPFIFKHERDLHIPASLAHDGRFVGYSFILDDLG